MLAICGLAIELISVYPVEDTHALFIKLTIFKQFSPTMNLLFMNSRLFEVYIYDSGLPLNFLNLFFFLLALIGAIIYTVSKGKESRLLRFSISSFVLYKGLSLLFTPIGLYRNFNLIPWSFSFVLLAIVAIIVNMAYIYGGYYILKSIAGEKELDIKTTTIGDDFIQTPKMQRLTHYVVDLCLCILICSTFLMSFGGTFFSMLESSLGRQVTMIMFVFFARILYFPIFETVFGASPGKLLTESRLLSTNGEKITFKQGFLRTLFRAVPFDAFTYLGNGNGWHDDWVDTMVVKEKRSGVPARKYLLIIPVFLLISGLTYTGTILYDKYEYYSYQKNEYLNKVEDIENHLSGLSFNSIIQLKKLNQPYSDDSYFLKVEKMEGDNITFSLLQKSDYSISQKVLESLYVERFDSLPQITIDRNLLYQCITKDFDNYSDLKRNGQALFHDSEKYEIYEMFQIFSPALKENGSSQSYNFLSFNIGNTGTPAQLISIENLEGDLQWENTLPQAVGASEYSWQTTLRLEASNFKKDQPYKFRLLLKDDLGEGYKYELTGKNNNLKIKRIYE